MPVETEQQQPNYLLLIIIAGVAFWLWSGNRGTDPVNPDPPGPVEPDEPVKPGSKIPAPADMWEAFAHCVETKSIGGMNEQNTDHLVKIADTMKSAGTLPDTSRVDGWRAARIEITDSNRASIVATLRGQ